LLAGTYEVHTSEDGTEITPGDHFTLEDEFSQYLSRRLEVGCGWIQSLASRRRQGYILLDNSVDTEVHGIGAQISYWTTPRLNILLKYTQEYNASQDRGDRIMLNFTYLPDPIF
jgi:hypothetical protein